MTSTEIGPCFQTSKNNITAQNNPVLRQNPHTLVSVAAMHNQGPGTMEISAFKALETAMHTSVRKKKLIYFDRRFACASLPSETRKAERTEN